MPATLSPLAQTKISERAELVARLEHIQGMAADDGNRDLTETEQSAMVQVRARLGQLDQQLGLMTADYQLDQETAANIARWSGKPVQAAEGHSWRTAGEAIWDYLHRETDREARSRIGEFEKIAQRSTSVAGRPSESVIQLRAAQHMGTVAANTTPTAGGFGGLIVSPVAGPVLDLGWTGTPLLTALGAQNAPNAFAFQRPRIIDPNIDNGVGPQAGGKEKGELVSYKFDVNSESVNMTLVGGYLNVSQQVISWLPGAWDIIIRQLTRRAERGAEKAAAGELAKATKIIPLADDADSAETIKALGDAAIAVFNATGAMPTWLAMGPLGWGKLFSLVDADGRQVFPSVNPVNALGSSSLTQFVGSVAGLSAPVTPGITDDSFYMGNGDSIELYRSSLPVLEAVEPSVLGRQVAVAVALGAYQPITTEAGAGNVPPAAREAIVKIG